MDYAKTRIACLTFALIVCTAIGFGNAAHATGVAAGTSIQNKATATFTNGASTQTVDSNTVTIVVDELLNVTVTSLDGGNVALDSSGAVLSFQVHNSGNGPEAFKIAVDPNITGDNFDPSVTSIAYDSNGNNVYDAGVDTVIPVGGSTPPIPADSSLRIFVVTALAGSPANGDLGDVRLTATAATGSGPAGTVFAGQGVGGSDAVVGTSTAQDNAMGVLIAQIGSVTLTKTATIANPFGGTDPVPGSTVTYSLVATVNGSSGVSGLTITDAIPTGTTYKASSLTLDGTSLTDASGDDAGQASSSGISVTIGSAAGGSSHTVKFSVTID
jgi:uncharacterized repeat protein (TIGR01451 family)